MVDRASTEVDQVGGVTMADTRHRERRVGDERVEAIARELSTNTVRLTNIESAMAAMQHAMQDIAKAMISVARVEERLAASHSHQQHMAGQIEELQRQLRTVAEQAAQQSSTASATNERSLWLERAFWIALTACVAYYTSAVLPT